jgi:uncharacterized membrane protein YraQ (UPF0718 family)
MADNHNRTSPKVELNSAFATSEFNKQNAEVIKANSEAENSKDKLEIHKKTVNFGSVLIIICLGIYLAITIFIFASKGDITYFDGTLELLKTVILTVMGFVFAKMSG